MLAACLSYAGYAGGHRCQSLFLWDHHSRDVSILQIPALPCTRNILRTTLIRLKPYWFSLGLLLTCRVPGTVWLVEANGWTPRGKGKLREAVISLGNNNVVAVLSPESHLGLCCLVQMLNTAAAYRCRKRHWSVTQWRGTGPVHGPGNKRRVKGKLFGYLKTDGITDCDDGDAITRALQGVFSRVAG